MAALARAEELARSVYVVDLAWLRSTPWRERVCSAFDPPRARPALREFSGGDRPPPAALREPPRCSS